MNIPKSEDVVEIITEFNMELMNPIFDDKQT